MSHGDAPITNALEELAMAHMTVISDQVFLFERINMKKGLDPPVMGWKKMCFGVEAGRGEMVGERLPRRFEGFYCVGGWKEAGGECSVCLLEGQGVEIIRRGGRGSQSQHGSRGHG